MNGIIDIMKKVAQKESHKLLTAELGIVTAVFPHKDKGDKENYQCTVKLKNKKLPDGSDFELLKVPVATPYIGFAAIPNVKDLVIVQFIGGSINAPVITHRLYNDEDRPPVNLEDELIIQHKKDNGGSIKMDKEGKILIRTKDEKTILTIADEKVSIENEDHQLIIDISGKKISLSTAGVLEVSAEKEIKIDSKKNVEVNVDGDAKVVSKGNVEINANGEASVTSKANVNVKGKAVTINGTQGKVEVL